MRNSGTAAKRAVYHPIRRRIAHEKANPDFAASKAIDAVEQPMSAARARPRRFSDKQTADPPRRRSQQRGARDGQEPRPDDALREAPSHRRQLAGCADADDRAGDGVSGRHGDTEPGSQKQRDRAAGFRAEPADGPELSDPHAHGLDDAPSAEQRAERNRSLARQHDPERDMKARPAH